MKAVVGTNVIAYYLLETEPQYGECAALWRSLDEAMAPASWEAEVVNLLWMAVRKRVIDLPEALRRLDRLQTLGLRSVPVQTLWHGSLTRAWLSGIAAHDTLFVELAEREGVPLATFDERVLAAFPRVAKRPRALTRS